MRLFAEHELSIAKKEKEKKYERWVYVGVQPVTSSYNC